MNGVVFNPVNPNELPSIPAGAMILFFTADGKLMAKDGAGTLRQVTSSVGSSYMWNVNTEDFPTIPVTDYGNRNMVEFVANKCIEGVHQFSVVGLRKWYELNGGYGGNAEFGNIQQFGDDTKTYIHISFHREIVGQFKEYNVVTFAEYPSAYNTATGQGYQGSYNSFQRFHKLFICANQDIVVADVDKENFIVDGIPTNVYYALNYYHPQIVI